MIRVMIVDDEPAALRSLRYLIPWEEHGFTIRAEAGSGEQALALFDEQGFDLMITDIKMPAMDGLQLAARVKRERDIPIFIVSGFHEFQYARQGIQLGVKDYLLKPVDAEELKACLLGAKRELERKALLEKQLYRGLPALRELAAEQWVKGEWEAARQLIELRLWPEWTESSFCVIVMELNGKSGSKAGSGGIARTDDGDIRLRCFAVRNIVEEQAGEYGLTFHDPVERRVVLICRLHEGLATESQLCAWGERLRQDILHYAKEELFIAIGSLAPSPDQVAQSYDAALSVCRLRQLNAEDGSLGTVVSAESALRANEGSALLVRKVQRLVRERFRENVELKRLAQELYVNPNYLGQQFKLVTGVTFKDYVLRLRMEAAKELLLYTDKKIYEIADEVGMKDLDWFYKRFKAYVGISANEFRASAVKGESNSESDYGHV